MAKPVLLLRLEGPLQSWGGRARWDVRDTQPEPTKSGVIGLLGCALGYERGDKRLEQLDRTLRYGVRIEAPGRILEDYQTVTGFLPTAGGEYKLRGTRRVKSLEGLKDDPDAKPSTIISPRFYLEDAAFLVGLETHSTEGDVLLENAAQAIQNPRWPLFLGRKACIPTRPIFDDFTTSYGDLREALSKRYWSWEAKPEGYKRPDSVVGFIESEGGQYRRQDALRVNPFRQYGFVNLDRFTVPFGEGTT